MKNILFFLVFACFIGQAQDFSVKANVVKKLKITGAERDSYVVPSGESWEVTLTDGTKWTNDEGVGWVLDSTGGGGSDGNDFVTAGNVSGTDLTLTVPNQTDPVIDLSDFPLDSEVVKLTGDQNILGNKTIGYIFPTTIESANGMFFGAGTYGANEKRWSFYKNGSDDVVFQIQNFVNTSLSGTYTELYTLNSTGVPSAATDLIDKTYADANYLGATGGVLLNTTNSNTGDFTIRNFAANAGLGNNNRLALDFDGVNQQTDLSGGSDTAGEAVTLRLDKIGAYLIGQTEAKILANGSMVTTRDFNDLHYAEIGTANNDVLTFGTLSDSYNYVAGDFTTGRLVKTHKGATDITVTVPNGVMPIGAKSSIKIKDTGKVSVIYGVGQDGIPFTVSDSLSTVTMVHYDYGGGDTRIEPIGTWDEYTTNIEISTDANAANSNDEADTITGFGSVGGIISSSSSTPITGAHSIYYVQDSGSTGERMTWTKSVTNGDEIRLRFTYIATGNANMNNQQGIDITAFAVVANGSQQTMDEIFTVTDATIFELRQYVGAVGSWKIDDYIVEIIN